MPLETLATAMNRLHERGYTDSFRVENGKLVATKADKAFQPEEVRVDEIVRFEGDTDPGDMAILFAIQVPGDAVRGTWSTSYGAEMPAGDSEVARELENGDGGRNGSRN